MSIRKVAMAITVHGSEQSFTDVMNHKERFDKSYTMIP